MILNASGLPIIKYDYDMFGKPTAYVCLEYKNGFTWLTSSTHITFENIDLQRRLWDEPWEVAETNPFRWKIYYYDAESGYYYISSRYYDPKAGVYLDADDPENIFGNASVFSGLDRNAIALDNYLEVEANNFDIFTINKMTTDITYDPNIKMSWWERHFGDILMILEAIIAIVITFLPGGQPYGIALLISAFLGSLVNALAETFLAVNKVLSGIATTINGGSAFWTGLSIFGCGPVGWVLGAICMLVGAVTMLLGVFEACEGAIGVNGLRDWLGDWGMSEEEYDMMYLGLNIASAVCTLINVLTQLVNDGHIARYGAGRATYYIRLK